MSLNIEIVAKDLTKTPEAKKKKMLLMVSLWAWGLLSLFISTSFASGVFVVAALFTMISLVVHDEPLRININETGLSMTKGRAFLWNAGSNELEGVEVVPQSKMMGVVFNPGRMVVHKRDGD